MQLRQLLVPEKGFLAGELSPAQQAGQFGPVRQFLLLVQAPLLAATLLLAVTLTTVGSH